jgi:signal transduction histidine kinase
MRVAVDPAHFPATIDAPCAHASGGSPSVHGVLDHGARDHIVQFYEAEDALTENVARFVAAGLRAGEPVIVIATPDHLAAFCERLDRDPDGIDRSRLVLLDARDTLAQFMVDDMPDWERFSTALGEVIQRARGGRADQRVRAYGEMVDVLWRDGNRQAAIRLEELWNDLGRDHAFSLLCAYTMASFYSSADAASFDEVCRVHDHVIPGTSYPRLDGADDRGRAIGSLHQRERALEREIAARRELEAALRESLARERALREEAERNVRFSDMFAGMLGHDLRNPLGTINMAAHYLARAKLGDKATRSATRIITSAERMSRMIDQLLDFTRIRAAGGLELHRTRVDLGAIAERVKDEIEAGIPPCNIELTASGDTCGMWDHDRLFQVLSNLVGNAVTHGVPGRPVQLEVDGREPSHVVAYVRNARAIDPEILPVIFDPFRGGKKRHNARGLGLGLFITRQIVLAHGGEIAVTSGEVGGTLVCVKLHRFSRVAEADTVTL